MGTQLREREVVLQGLGIRTRILEAGAGTPVLLLHGHPDNAEQWSPLMRLLAARHRCIAPDLPGFGRSPEPPAAYAYTVQGQVDFVDAVLKAAGVEEPLILVVHDVGGIMGLPWAARNLSRLRGVMFTNTVAYEGFPWFEIAKQWGDASWRGRLRSRLGFFVIGLAGGALFKRVFWSQSPQLAEAEVDRVTKSFALSHDAREATLRLFTEVVKPDFFAGYDAMMREVTARVPSRLLWGDGDPYLPTKYAGRFAKAKATVLPRAGHWVSTTATAELAREIAALG